MLGGSITAFINLIANGFLMALKILQVLQRNSMMQAFALIYTTFLIVCSILSRASCLK
jgi:hypothetical protein